MLKRVLTGAVILIVTLGFVLLKQFSDIIFDVFVLILAYGALFEVKKAYRDVGKKSDPLLYLIPALACLIFNLEKRTFVALGYLVLLSLCYLLYLLLKEIIVYALKRKRGETLEREEMNKILFDGTKISMQIYAYPLVLISLFFALNHLSYEVSYMGIILSYAISMLTDTLALFIGMAFGKRKFAPEISPGKTVAGVFGGLLGGIIGTLCCFLFFYYTPFFSEVVKANLTLYIVIFSVISVFGSLADQLGDLVESALKRKVGIKDSGHIFPGHGGFMDRIDGLMFTSSLIFIVFALFLV